jgi:uncharacterized protein YheU (UPF0270 family)
MALFGVTDPLLNGPDEDADEDGKNNLVELALGFDPNSDGDLPPTSTLEDDVLTEMATLIGTISPLPLNLAPADDYDGDGKTNLVELALGSAPTYANDTPVSSEIEDYVLTEVLESLGQLFPLPDNYAPTDDYDADGESNIAELLYGTDPTDGADSAGLSALQIFVAEEMAEIGVFGAGAVNFAPDDDYDFDTLNNLIELLSGTNPTDVDSVPAFSADSLEAFVIEELANEGVLEQDSASIGPYDDYDADTISNIVELMYATNPNDDTDTLTLSSLDITVAEELAALLNPVQYGSGLDEIEATGDFDADGHSNIDELNNETNPNDAGDPGP